MSSFESPRVLDGLLPEVVAALREHLDADASSDGGSLAASSFSGASQPHDRRGPQRGSSASGSAVSRDVSRRTVSAAGRRPSGSADRSACAMPPPLTTEALIRRAAAIDSAEFPPCRQQRLVRDLERLAAQQRTGLAAATAADGDTQPPTSAATATLAALRRKSHSSSNASHPSRRGGRGQASTAEARTARIQQLIERQQAASARPLSAADAVSVLLGGLQAMETSLGHNAAAALARHAAHDNARRARDEQAAAHRQSHVAEFWHRAAGYNGKQVTVPVGPALASTTRRATGPEGGAPHRAAADASTPPSLSTAPTSGAGSEAPHAIGPHPTEQASADISMATASSTHSTSDCTSSSDLSDADEEDRLPRACRDEEVPRCRGVFPTPPELGSELGSEAGSHSSFGLLDVGAFALESWRCEHLVAPRRAVDGPADGSTAAGTGPFPHSMRPPSPSDASSTMSMVAPPETRQDRVTRAVALYTAAFNAVMARPSLNQMEPPRRHAPPLLHGYNATARDHARTDHRRRGPATAPRPPRPTSTALPQRSLPLRTPQPPRPQPPATPSPRKPLRTRARRTPANQRKPPTTVMPPLALYACILPLVQSYRTRRALARLRAYIPRRAAESENFSSALASAAVNMTHNDETFPHALLLDFYRENPCAYGLVFGPNPPVIQRAALAEPRLPPMSPAGNATATVALPAPTPLVSAPTPPHAPARRGLDEFAQSLRVERLLGGSTGPQVPSTPLTVVPPPTTPVSAMPPSGLPSAPPAPRRWRALEAPVADGFGDLLIAMQEREEKAFGTGLVDASDAISPFRVALNMRALLTPPLASPVEVVASPDEAPFSASTPEDVPVPPGALVTAPVSPPSVPSSPLREAAAILMGSPEEGTILMGSPEGAVAILPPTGAVASAIHTGLGMQGIELPWNGPPSPHHSEPHRIAEPDTESEDPSASGSQAGSETTATTASGEVPSSSCSAVAEAVTGGGEASRGIEEAPDAFAAEEDDSDRKVPDGALDAPPTAGLPLARLLLAYSEAAATVSSGSDSVPAAPHGAPCEDLNAVTSNANTTMVHRGSGAHEGSIPSVSAVATPASPTQAMVPAAVVAPPLFSVPSGSCEWPAVRADTEPPQSPQPPPSITIDGTAAVVVAPKALSAAASGSPGSRVLHPRRFHSRQLSTDIAIVLTAASICESDSPDEEPLLMILPSVSVSASTAADAALPSPPTQSSSSGPDSRAGLSDFVAFADDDDADDALVPQHMQGPFGGANEPEAFRDHAPPPASSLDRSSSSVTPTSSGAASVVRPASSAEASGSTTQDHQERDDGPISAGFGFAASDAFAGVLDGCFATFDPSSPPSDSSGGVSSAVRARVSSDVSGSADPRRGPRRNTAGHDDKEKEALSASNLSITKGPDTEPDTATPATSTLETPAAAAMSPPAAAVAAPRQSAEAAAVLQRVGRAWRSCAPVTLAALCGAVSELAQHLTQPSSRTAWYREASSSASSTSSTATGKSQAQGQIVAGLDDDTQATARVVLATPLDAPLAVLMLRLLRLEGIDRHLAGRTHGHAHDHPTTEIRAVQFQRRLKSFVAFGSSGEEERDGGVTLYDGDADGLEFGPSASGTLLLLRAVLQAAHLLGKAVTARVPGNGFASHGAAKPLNVAAQALLPLLSTPTPRATPAAVFQQLRVQSVDVTYAAVSMMPLLSRADLGLLRAAHKTAAIAAAADGWRHRRDLSLRMWARRIAAAEVAAWDRRHIVANRLQRAVRRWLAVRLVKRLRRERDRSTIYGGEPEL